MHVFRRDDVRAVRCSRAGFAEFTLEVVHVDLYFFEDVNVVLNWRWPPTTWPTEAQIMYRFGRGYPSGWDDAGQPLHAMAGVDWLDDEGLVLASSDAQSRDAYLTHVREHRAPRIAAHWEFMLKPLVPDHSELKGALRYRQIEYYRMPLMAYLAVDEPRALARSDFIRLGLVTCRRQRAAVRRAALVTSSSAIVMTVLVRRRRRRARATCATAMRWWWWAMRARVLPLPRPRRAGAISPPALHAVHDRSRAEGVASDVL
jgi:hypothetical protein